VANVSVVDLNCSLKKETTAEAVNAALKAASEGKLKGILDYTDEDVVSVDFNHDPASATVDAKMTKVIAGNFLKVLAWYDNEWGYSCRVVELCEYLVRRGL
jgi:glyceraldehyde 3-phosphate dehydrogenase